LEAALARRTYHLNIANKADARDPDAAHRRARRAECHEHVKRLVGDMVRGFGELDRWDEESQVGMGGEVAGFLEGFLEEVLVRVEPADD
jgi:serine/threonine-protein kinase 24/25/MST4